VLCFLHTSVYVYVVACYLSCFLYFLYYFYLYIFTINGAINILVGLMFLAFCVLEETTGINADDLDEDGAGQHRLPRAVMDRCSPRGPELTTLEAVGDQWHYTLVVVQSRDDDDDVPLRDCLPTVVLLVMLMPSVSSPERAPGSKNRPTPSPGRMS